MRVESYMRAVLKVRRPLQVLPPQARCLATCSFKNAVMASDQPRLAIGIRCLDVLARASHCGRSNSHRIAFAFSSFRKFLHRYPLSAEMFVSFQGFANSCGIGSKKMRDVVMLMSLKFKDPNSNRLVEVKRHTFDRDNVYGYPRQGACRSIHGVTPIMDALGLPFGTGWQAQPGGRVVVHPASTCIIRFRSLDCQSEKVTATSYKEIENLGLRTYVTRPSGNRGQFAQSPPSSKIAPSYVGAA